MIEVILREDVKSLGKAGELVRVKPGYARNYLLPQAWRTRRPRATRSGSRRRAEGPGRAERRPSGPRPSASPRRWARVTLTLTGKAGEEGKLFGSITAQDIAEALAKLRDTMSTSGGSSWSTRSRRSATTPWASGSIPRFTPRCACPSSRSEPDADECRHRLCRRPTAEPLALRGSRLGGGGPGRDQPDQRVPGPRWRYRHQLQPDPSRRRRCPPGARRRAASGHGPHHGPGRGARRPRQFRHDARPLSARFHRVARPSRPRRRPATWPGRFGPGADRSYESLDDPREGTILTVAREAAAAAERTAAETEDIGEFMRGLLDEGETRPGPDARADGRPQGSRGGGCRWQGVRPDAGGRRPLHRGRSDPAGAPTNGSSAEAVSIPAALVDVAAERDFQLLHRGAGPRRAASRGQRGRAPPCTRSAARSSSRWRATFSRSMCTRTPRRPSLAMRPAGDGWRPPRPTTCGRSTGSWPTPSAGRWRWSPTAPPTSRTRARSAPHRAGPAPGGLRRRDLPGPGGAQAGGVLPPAAHRAGAARRRPSPRRPSSCGCCGTRGRRPTKSSAVLLSAALSGTYASAQAAVRAAGISGVHLVDSRSASLGVGHAGAARGRAGGGGLDGPRTSPRS